MYRCEATSIRGFIQQLAVGYITHGYWFYVTGVIPEPKDPRHTDDKLFRQYDVDVSKWTRCRRKKAGFANVQYLRYGRFWVLLATHGQHPFFTAEAGQIRDVRESPIHFAGYSIGCRPGRRDGRSHPSVRIQRRPWQELKAGFEARAVHVPIDELGWQLRNLGFEPYAPVRDQCRILLRAVNRRRKAAGLEPISPDVLRKRRVPVKPFD